MRSLAAIVAFVCSTTACQSRVEPVAVPAPALIDLRPMTISFRGQPIARLFAGGHTESAGPNAPGSEVGLLPGPTLHSDGTMVMTRGGVTARLDAKGEIHLIGPPDQLFGRIEGDVLKFAGSRNPWDVRVKGTMIEFGEENSSQIDGEVTPGMRHTALVMAAAFSIDGSIAAP